MTDFTREDVAHLLRRSGFFARTSDVDALMGEASWADVVERVLDTAANPAESTPAGVSNPSTLQAIVAGTRYWMDRMVTTPTPLVERMAFFWHGILTSAAPNPDMPLVFAQIRTWRDLGLGDLHDLMQAMAIDPAMLDYLDNAGNKKASPNENFARELMELFTMGNFTFTETDVAEMARAWTGHNLIGDQYVFLANRHDTGQKTIFGITRNWDGPETITEIVRGSKQPVCARYLAGRIWGALADPSPTDDLLDELRDALIGVDMVVRDFLRIVFTRPEFRLPATRLALVRSPVEWEVAILAHTGVTIDQLQLATYQQRLGQVLYRPPNVSGWRQNGAWISSSTVWAKGGVASALASALSSSTTFADLPAMSTSDAVATVLERMGVDEPAPATVGHLEAYLDGERSAGRGGVASSVLPALVTLTPDFQLA